MRVRCSPRYIVWGASVLAVNSVSQAHQERHNTLLTARRNALLACEDELSKLGELVRRYAFGSTATIGDEAPARVELTMNNDIAAIEQLPSVLKCRTQRSKLV